MYRASELFMAEIKKSARIEHVRGSINGWPFDDRNIMALSYSNKSSDKKDVSLGYAYIGQITATFFNIPLSRGSWRGATIVLDYGLELPNDTVEYIPIGVFTVNEAKWTDVGISVTASDVLSKLDRPFSISQTNGRPYDLLMLAARDCDIELGLTEEECANLPNGQENLGLYPSNDINTYRDFVAWISQVLGGFVTATRDGKMTVKSYGQYEVVDTLDSTDRLVGASFSDYTTQYDGISIVEIDSQQTFYYSVNDGVGGILALGANPLLQYGLEETKQEQRIRIADVAKTITYTPFNIDVLNSPIYDLGDIIKCVEGIAGDGELVSCVMAIDWTFKQTTSLAGYGADPSLTYAKSRADKAINGLLSNTSKDEVVSYTFVNAKRLELSSSYETTVISIKFATVSPRVIDFLAELNLETMLGIDESVDVEVRYYLNDELIPEYKPRTSWNNTGMHLMHLMYFFSDLLKGTVYNFDVRMILKSGTASIAPEHIHAAIKGQGLVAINDFDGLIEVKDDYEPISVPTELNLNDAINSLEFTRSHQIGPFNDEYEPLSLDPNISIDGMFDLKFETPIYTRVTEDRVVRVTEDRQIRRTE